MVVQHNLQAMNANRMLNVNTKTQAKSTEKLSSGYKINRAADDAAGLSISEKMRKQIRGLSQASLNAQDGISAVQTAEGALNEVQDMLQRMNELAVKAGNGTMSEDDRTYIQNEIDQLVTEIDRVSETTKFNETYLLKGDGVKDLSEDKKYADLGADKPVTAKISDANGKKITTSAVTDTNTGETKLNLGNLENVKAGDSIVIDGITYKFIAGTTDGSPDDDSANATKTEINIDIYKNGKSGAEVKRSADELATQIAKIVKEQTDARTAADVTKGDIESVSVMKIDGNYILTAQSKLDATRTNSVAKEYTTDSGIVIKTEANQKIHDGQILTVGKVQQVGTMTKHDGTTVNGVKVNAATGYDIDVTKYEGEATSFVWNATDNVWKSNAKDENGNVLTYSTADLKKMGIGVLKQNDSDAELEALDAAGKGFALADGFTLKIEKGTKADSSDTALVKDANINLNGLDLSGYEVGDEIKVKINVSKGGTITVSDVPVEEELKPLHFSLQVGADTSEENKISIDIESMSAKNLGVEKVRVDGKDSTNADAAVDVIAEAIQKVSTQRSALGAVQNRLEHTINNLDNVVENTTSAESAIRDTDMASEMVKYSNNNILAQAGQAMLAQANQSNQGVLSLLG